MNHLNYHHLFYFRTIATEGSVSKAAQKLRLGQPALSMQLKQFEEQLGHELFSRKSRNLVLTEMGHLVLGYANDIFRMGEEMLDAIHDRPKSKKLRLQLGAMDSIPKILVQQLVQKVLISCKESPKSESLSGQVSVVEGRGADLVEEMLNHHLDLVLANSAAPSLTTERIYSKKVNRSPLVVVGTSQFQSYRLHFPKSLDRAPLLLPNHNSRVRNEVDHFFEKNHIQPDVVAEAQDLSLLLQLAMNHQGLLITSAISVEKELAQNQLMLMGELKDYYEEIWLLSAERKIKNPLAEILLATPEV